MRNYRSSQLFIYGKKIKADYIQLVRINEFPNIEHFTVYNKVIVNDIIKYTLTYL